MTNLLMHQTIPSNWEKKGGAGASTRPVSSGAHVKGYRADVDGLRAVAVIVILLYHGEIAPFAGGFVGVDIFFVISGYLITRLISAEIAAGTFSIALFYERRIRRIFPALIATLAGTMLIGAILLLPNDFASMGRNVAGTTLFASNIFFWKQASYFEGDAHLKPLLHTWSLAVEEQFYIVFPLLLVALHRFWPRRMRAAIVVLAAVSFAASVVMMATSESTAFYLTPFRAWELLLGSLLALGAVPSIGSAAGRNGTAFLGASMVGYSVFAYTDATTFPGMAALLPCVGTALIIHAGTGGTSLIGKALSARVAIWFGLISYSVYLWHWPLFVFTRYYMIEELTLPQSFALVLASIGVGALSWRYIELPFRTGAAFRIRSRVFVMAAVAMVALFAAGVSTYAARGWPGRFSQEVRALSDYALAMNPKSDMCERVKLQLASDSPCTIGDPAKAGIFLFGDSHAGALYGALDQIAREGVSTIYGATPRCPPLLNMGSSQKCIAANRRRFDYVLAHPEIRTVIIAARWSFYFKGRFTDGGPAETNDNLPVMIGAQGEIKGPAAQDANATLGAGLTPLVDQLLAAGRRVVLVYPVPETGYDIPSTLARRRVHGEAPASFTMSRAIYERRQREAIAMLDRLGERDGLVRLYPQDTLCPGNTCLTYANGAPIYFDSHHLSIPGSRLLLPQLRSAISLPPQNLDQSSAAHAMANAPNNPESPPRPGETITLSAAK